MANLDHLKIKKAPAAFAAWARNFNQQVDLIASIQGGPGIDVSIAHSPRKVHHRSGDPRPKEQPRGKILMTLRPSAAAGLGIGSGGSSTGNTTQAVGINGLLLDVVQPTSPNTPATYPSILRAGNGSARVIADSTGLTVFANNTNSCAISFANITRPISIRTINICNGNSVMSMDIIASAPY